ncbi:hypothetical protein J6590_057731 [Homalodisca vitripennis]|nr:hypothetical protein J6590_057731 [Homalodisca vitripennis]
MFGGRRQDCPMTITQSRFHNALCMSPGDGPSDGGEERQWWRSVARSRPFTLAGRTGPGPRTLFTGPTVSPRPTLCTMDLRPFRHLFSTVVRCAQT